MNTTFSLTLFLEYAFFSLAYAGKTIFNYFIFWANFHDTLPMGNLL